MTGVPGTQRHGEIPGEDEGRDPGDASASQRPPKWPAAMEREQVISQNPQDEPALGHPDLRLLGLQILRLYLSVF